MLAELYLAIKTTVRGLRSTFEKLDLERSGKMKEWLNLEHHVREERIDRMKQEVMTGFKTIRDAIESTPWVESKITVKKTRHVHFMGSHQIKMTGVDRFNGMLILRENGNTYNKSLVHVDGIGMCYVIDKYDGGLKSCYDYALYEKVRKLSKIGHEDVSIHDGNTTLLGDGFLDWAVRNDYLNIPFMFPFDSIQCNDGAFIVSPDAVLVKIPFTNQIVHINEFPSLAPVEKPGVGSFFKMADRHVYKVAKARYDLRECLKEMVVRCRDLGWFAEWTWEKTPVWEFIQPVHARILDAMDMISRD